MSGRDLPSRLERYRSALDARVGARSLLANLEPRVPRDGPVCAIFYVDVPERRHVTGFTYGLSLLSHPEWKNGGRELSITIRSRDVRWASVPARVVAALRGICPFNPGQVLGYSEPYVDESPMSSLALASPAIDVFAATLDIAPDGSEATTLDRIELVGAYPIYSTEREFAQSQGFRALWAINWDRFDPLRPAVV